MQFCTSETSIVLLSLCSLFLCFSTFFYLFILQGVMLNIFSIYICLFHIQLDHSYTNSYAFGEKEVMMNQHKQCIESLQRRI